MRLHEFGAPLRLESLPEPVPTDGEALLTVAFAGVNPIDLWLTQGLVRGGRQRLPMIPGSDASGFVDGRRVVAHGSGLGVIRNGLYAQRAAVPVEALVDIPDGVGLEDAAAVGVPGSTAWILTHDMARVTAADRILVLGCTGGVGSLLIQLTANTGATVFGHTSNPEKAEFIRTQLGCEFVVGDEGSVAGAVRAVEPTIVFDPLGNGYTSEIVASLRRPAKIILFGTSAGGSARLDLRAMYKKGVSIRGYSATANPPQATRNALRRILDELATGRVTPFVDSVLPLVRAQDAHQLLVDKKVTGKLLLKP